MLVGVVAVVFALVGTAVAQDPVQKLTKAKVRAIVKKELASAAPDLSVFSAKNATNATNALNALSATSATNANHATTATNATSAANAQVAASAKAPDVYAHVTEDGDVEEARSKGINDGDVARVGDTGVYCFTAPATFGTVQATQSIETVTATTTVAVVTAIRGDGSGACATAGINGAVLTVTTIPVDESAASEPEPFDIWCGS